MGPKYILTLTFKALEFLAISPIYLLNLPSVTLFRLRILNLFCKIENPITINWKNPKINVKAWTPFVFYHHHQMSFKRKIMLNNNYATKSYVNQYFDIIKACATTKESCVTTHEFSRYKLLNRICWKHGRKSIKTSRSANWFASEEKSQRYYQNIKFRLKENW